MRRVDEDYLVTVTMKLTVEAPRPVEKLTGMV